MNNLLQMRLRGKGFWWATALLGVLLGSGWFALGSGGAISVISVNQVSSATAQYRWEPSSTDTGGWITSYHDIPSPRGQVMQNQVHAYTSSWTGGGWSTPVEHRAGGNPMMDQSTYWDSYHSRYTHVALDYSVGWNSAYVAWSTDGNSWSSPIQVLAGDPFSNTIWDFPSVSTDNNGRIVVGASKLVNFINEGYWATYSSDGGATWNGPYRVGTLPGQTSRLVSSASGFHAFIEDTSSLPTIILRHWSSSDGVTWIEQATVSTFVLPLPSSPGSIVCSGGTCGELYYAPTPDAVGSSGGLGWVVAYAVNISGRNAINVTTELGGGVTITHTTDLFSHGITTSTLGDWHLNYQTYQGGDHVLPLLQGVVYRTSGSPTYPGAVIYANIDPSGWFYLTSPGRCTNAPCFASGDFFRPASNAFTGASIPLVVPSANLTDLMQVFIQDPPVGNVPQFVPHIEPYIQGEDLTPRAVITPAHLNTVNVQKGKPAVSTMIGEALRQAHITN